MNPFGTRRGNLNNQTVNATFMNHLLIVHRDCSFFHACFSLFLSPAALAESMYTSGFNFSSVWSSDIVVGHHSSAHGVGCVAMNDPFNTLFNNNQEVRPYQPSGNSAHTSAR